MYYPTNKFWSRFIKGCVTTDKRLDTLISSARAVFSTIVVTFYAHFLHARSHFVCAHSMLHSLIRATHYVGELQFTHRALQKWVHPLCDSDCPTILTDISSLWWLVKQFNCSHMQKFYVLRKKEWTILASDYDLRWTPCTNVSMQKRWPWPMHKYSSAERSSFPKCLSAKRSLHSTLVHAPMFKCKKGHHTPMLLTN